VGDVRTRYFMSAPLIVAGSDLIATCPYQLARYFAGRIPIAILEPPTMLPKYSEYLAWHERYDADPALRWLRGVFAEAARAALQRG
jgi:DNA-binding transcriptional LysR family regulator